MNKIFQKGMVIKIEEDSDKKYIIIESLEKDDKVYILLTDLDDKIDLQNKEEQKIQIDYSKMFMVSCDKESLEIEYNHDEEIVRQLVKKSMEK